MLWFVFFLASHSVSRHNLRSLFFPANKRKRTEALTQCAELSQFVVDYFFHSLTYFASGFKSLNCSATANVSYSSKLIIALSLSQPTHICSSAGVDCVFGAGISASSTQTEFVFITI